MCLGNADQQRRRLRPSRGRGDGHLLATTRWRGERWLASDGERWLASDG